MTFWAFLDKHLRMLVAAVITVLCLIGGGYILLTAPTHAEFVKALAYTVLGGGGVFVLKNGNGNGNGYANGGK